MRSMFRTVLVALVAVAALGTVASASASAAPSWTVNGVKQKGGGRETVASKGGRFTLRIGLDSLECSKEKDSGEIIFTEPGTGTSKITFEGCVTYSTPSNCEVSDTGSGKIAGTIRTNELTTELRTYAGVSYEVFQAASGPIATVEIKNREKKVCNEKGQFALEGSGCAQVGPEATALSFKMSEAIQNKCGVELKTGATKDFVVGNSERTLTGVKIGQPFGAA